MKDARTSAAPTSINRFMMTSLLIGTTVLELGPAVSGWMQFNAANGMAVPSLAKFSQARKARRRFACFAPRRNGELPGLCRARRIAPAPTPTKARPRRKILIKKAAPGKEPPYHSNLRRRLLVLSAFGLTALGRLPVLP